MADGTFLGSTFLLSNAFDEQLRPAATWTGNEFIAAWEDKRRSAIHFDERTDIYGSRVSADGVVLDPAGVPLAAESVPETHPTFITVNGQTLMAVSTLLSNDPTRGSFRIGIRGTVLEPATFCTAKAALFCGQPAVAFTGQSSATSTSGFTISAGPARSCKSGILLYSDQSTVPGIPFQGGTLCLTPMGLRRAGSTNSMGTPGPSNCDGEFSVDMNAFAQSAWVVPGCNGLPSGIPANSAAGFLTNAGTTVSVQFWGRDSIATGSFVSDGLQYVVGL